MSESELVEFLRTRMRVQLSIDEDGYSYGGLYNGHVKIFLAPESGNEEVLICEDSCSFIVDTEK